MQKKSFTIIICGPERSTESDKNKFSYYVYSCPTLYHAVSFLVEDKTHDVYVNGSFIDNTNLKNKYVNDGDIITLIPHVRLISDNTNENQISYNYIGNNDYLRELDEKIPDHPIYEKGFSSPESILYIDDDGRKEYLWESDNLIASHKEVSGEVWVSLIRNNYPYHNYTLRFNSNLGDERYTFSVKEIDKLRDILDDDFKDRHPMNVDELPF
ncbi:MAG: hypothetical protein ACO20H_13580 [Bacteriovoracaceae bacterium]